MTAQSAGARRRREGRGRDTATVSVHVHNLAQMFNSLDPSPFWDRDLDREAAEFIEEEFSDKRGSRHWRLNVQASEGADLTADLHSAVGLYYQRLAGSTHRLLREQLRLGQLSLLGGSAIFLLSMSARQILASLLPHGMSRLLDEGLIILAWLALWRPAESLVYGWVPLWRKWKMYQRLAAIQVSVRVGTARAGGGPPPGAKQAGSAPPAPGPAGAGNPP